MTAHDRRSAAGSDGDSTQSPGQAWQELAADYEQARARADSLDRLVEWPAERDILGDVTGRSILDLGCGNGGKLAELVREAGAGGRHALPPAAYAPRTFLIIVTPAMPAHRHGPYAARISPRTWRRRPS